MNRIKDFQKLEDHIVKWMENYLTGSGMSGWVLGVSGGLDSAVVSTLAAKTRFPVMVLEMPIKQAKTQVDWGRDHISWLKRNFNNVQSRKINLIHSDSKIEGQDSEVVRHDTDVYGLLIKQLNNSLGCDIIKDDEIASLADANSRARLRMLMLYYTATITSSLVVGTGNKVEDFGVGFYTKYGDGGVDLSPIADLYKTEVRELGKHLGIIDEIITAAPTDGLWNDERTDEDQLGATYENLEWAMEHLEIQVAGFVLPSSDDFTVMYTEEDLEDIEEEHGKEKAEAVKILVSRYRTNKHKMDDIPVCYISNLI